MIRGIVHTADVIDYNYINQWPGSTATHQNYHYQTGPNYQATNWNGKQNKFLIQIMWITLLVSLVFDKMWL